jgi:excisionase family DNA binding protein
MKRKGVEVKTQLLSVHQFSESTGISTSTIYRKAQNGSIPAVSVAGQVRIPAWYLDELTQKPGELPSWLKKEAIDEIE